MQSGSNVLASTNGSAKLTTSFTAKVWQLQNSSSKQTMTTNFDDGSTGIGTSSPGAVFSVSNVYGSSHNSANKPLLFALSSRHFLFAFFGRPLAQGPS
jgi:hypothetical protein